MTQRDDYDSPWKDILTDYFEQFTVFFFPDIALKIDWSRGYNSLDKELRQITREAEIGGRLADKLFQVWEKNGEETWVLAHVEVQAQRKTDFPHRTFICNYRSYDLYKRPVASLAVLADDNLQWRPCERIGLRKGMHQEGTKILLRLMEARFGAIPQWAKERIEQAEIAAIEDWSIRLLSANSPEEMLAEGGKGN